MKRSAILGAMTIPANLQTIQARIAAASGRAQRNSAEMRLVAVTKTIAVEPINAALAAGITDIGENRVQEAEGKFAQLNSPVCHHLIGHLQSNKVRLAVELFDWIHSVDSIKLAEKLNHWAGILGRRLVVLAQVDLGKEPTKEGVEVEFLPPLADYLANCTQLDFRGLMTVPPYFDDVNLTRPYFAQLRALKEQLNNHLAKPLTELSMGMSHDFEVAIEEGATIIRVGTALFGVRPPKND